MEPNVNLQISFPDFRFNIRLLYPATPYSLYDPTPPFLDSDRLLSHSLELFYHVDAVLCSSLELLGEHLPPRHYYYAPL